MTHKELVQRAKKWLKNSCGCGFVFTELRTNCYEQPDAIGWRDGLSILVECKATRSDFLADKKKPFRICPPLGMGSHRYYLTLPGVIKPEDLPEGWGLLYCHPKKIEKVVSRVKSNMWHPPVFKRNQGEEIRMMCSALRRLELRGYLDSIYENPFKESQVNHEMV